MQTSGRIRTFHDAMVLKASALVDFGPIVNFEDADELLREMEGSIVNLRDWLRIACEPDPSVQWLPHTKCGAGCCR